MQDEHFETIFHTHLRSVAPWPSVALLHTLLDFTYCLLCLHIHQLCPASHRKCQKSPANSSPLLSALLVSPCQLVSTLLLYRDYFHSNIHMLWTMHVTFKTGTGKETGPRRGHFQRDCGAGLAHMDKNCLNTQKNKMFGIWDTTAALEPNKYDAVWCCTYSGYQYSVIAVLQC